MGLLQYILGDNKKAMKIFTLFFISFFLSAFSAIAMEDSNNNQERHYNRCSQDFFIECQVEEISDIEKGLSYLKIKGDPKSYWFKGDLKQEGLTVGNIINMKYRFYCVENDNIISHKHAWIITFEKLG